MIVPCVRAAVKIELVTVMESIKAWATSAMIENVTKTEDTMAPVNVERTRRDTMRMVAVQKIVGKFHLRQKSRSAEGVKRPKL